MADYIWNELRPYGNFDVVYRDVACNYLGNIILVAGNCPSAAFFKDFWAISNDYGENWTVYNTGTLFKSFACSETGQYIIATGLSDGLLYTSYNYGVDWIARTAEAKTWMAVACSQDGSRMGALRNEVDTSGIALSSDYGVTWEDHNPLVSLDSLFESNGTIAFDADGSNIIVGAWNSRHNETSQLYVSNDWGESWTKIGKGVNHVTEYPLEPGEDISWNGDFQWESVASNFDGSILLASESRAQSDSACYSGQVWLSTDYGATWYDVSPGKGENSPPVEGCPDGYRGRNWQEVAINYYGTKIALCDVTTYTETGRVYYSSDFTNTWNETQPKGDLDIDWHFLAINANGDHLYVAELNGRLYGGPFSGIPTYNLLRTSNDTYYEGVAITPLPAKIELTKGSPVVAYGGNQHFNNGFVYYSVTGNRNTFNNLNLIAAGVWGNPNLNAGGFVSDTKNFDAITASGEFIVSGESTISGEYVRFTGIIQHNVYEGESGLRLARYDLNPVWQSPILINTFPIQGNIDKMETTNTGYRRTPYFFFSTISGETVSGEIYSGESSEFYQIDKETVLMNKYMVGLPYTKITNIRVDRKI